jgi:hypothetical protein
LELREGQIIFFPDLSAQPFKYEKMQEMIDYLEKRKLLDILTEKKIGD